MKRSAPTNRSRNRLRLWQRLLESFRPADPARCGNPTRRRRTTGLRVQPLESRQLMAADAPFGATSLDTGEYLLGTVAVTPVLFESNGTIDPDTENWTDTEVDDVLAKVAESVNWWKDLLATQTSVHTLDFVIDDTFARNRVSTGYEPISRSSNTFERYVGDWLTAEGYGDAPSIERAVNQFNDAQREIHQTDWAFTIFIVDSSADSDGFFGSSSSFPGAFAFPGGLFYVVPSTRPTSTFAHEMGHIFWARDQYPGAGSWTDQRGYYDAQNWNAADNPTPGWVQQDSIMRGGVAAQRAYDNLFTEPSALAMVGWQDSDGDGVFDVLDVPLQIDAAGYFDADSSNFRFSGTARVDTLANQNSAGFQSDITLARVRELQYQLDDGDWQTAFSADAVSLDFALDISITETFDNIRWRAIDTQTGVTSEVLEGTTHVFSGNGGGMAFVDENGNGSLDGDETTLEASVTILDANGDPLFRSGIDANALDDGVITPSGGLSAESIGVTLDGRVAALQSTTLPGHRVLQGWDTQQARWNDQWSDRRKLRIHSDHDVGRVEVAFTGLDTGGYGVSEGSFARVEVFDRAGVRIDRVTSEMVAAGTSDRLVIEDPTGRIASVAIYGHAETEILVSSVEFGADFAMPTDAAGNWHLTGLADGDYTAELTAPNVTMQFDPVSFSVTAGRAGLVLAAAARVDSPRHNSAMPGDVDQNGELAPRDALVVINDLSRFGSRTISADELEGPAIDVNNDGLISAIDALRVINLLQRASEAEAAEGESEPPPLSQPLAQTSPGPAISTDHSAETSFGLAEESAEPAKMGDSAGEIATHQSLRVLPTDSTIEAVSSAGANSGAPRSDQLHLLEKLSQSGEIGSIS